MHRGAFGWKPDVWGDVVQFWITSISVARLTTLIGYAAGRKMLRKMLLTRMIGPGCGATYKQSLFWGLNFGKSRYERCGVSRNWHWVTMKNLAPEKAK